MAKKPPAKPAPKKRKPPREVELKPDKRSANKAPPAPIALSKVLGQDRAIELLTSSMESGRIPHAWIFHGPVGVGKFTTALAFAAVILDPSTQRDLSGRTAPDPDSAVQVMLRSGTYPDLHIITKELAEVSREPTIRDSKQRNIAKDVLLEFLIEPAERTRMSSQKSLASKVFIVDEAELIEGSGQNSLLKTLEEPPEGSVIILVTSSEDRLLPTVRSRCRPVAFAPLGEADMKKWLEGSGLDFSTVPADARRWLMAFADGSPGAAKLALQTGLVSWHSALAPMLAEMDAGKFPIDFGTAAAKLVDEWAVAAVERSESETASKDAANKAGARLMFRMLGGHFRARLREAVAKGAPEDRMERDLAALDRLREAERQFDASVQGIFVFDSLAAAIVTPKRM